MRNLVEMIHPKKGRLMVHPDDIARLEGLGATLVTDKPNPTIPPKRMPNLITDEEDD